MSLAICKLSQYFKTTVACNGSPAPISPYVQSVSYGVLIQISNLGRRFWRAAMVSCIRLSLFINDVENVDYWVGVQAKTRTSNQSKI